MAYSYIRRDMSSGALALFLLLSACGPPPEIANIVAEMNAAGASGASTEDTQLAGRLTAVGLTCAQVVKTEPYEMNSGELLVTCRNDATQPTEVRYVYNSSKGTARLPEADWPKQ